mmetsp:Transcript_33055/g.97523  ORF Transcript_33055/g.97523 Transcript_33055/m.97523 type:complete len:151 (-) Transcript_33055:241-693(-)|eukprot:CAMPEP_0181043076 /NCGR_PEP_ID=MMETSP1070-20121207/12507_1 /TAXON_ID=265543 /ORGANISM="Minutocellus polymorphus, Strain NH13" /LENGTH=150 /DNA_ID=CAMNT_0023121365 /DNA_START=134 /DNA_END=586 /DNA_ORIENTATION=+
MALRGIVSSVLRRPLAGCCVPSALPSPNVGVLATAASCATIPRQPQQPPTATATTTTIRSYWQEVVRGTTDPRDNRNRYEDPDQAAQRSGRAQNSEGLLRRAVRYRRYEKPWMTKKRLANDRAFRNQKRGVDELKMYIQFVQQHTPDGKE